MELMFVVGCLALLGSLISWGILAQIDTHRRLTIQANRQGVMRAVLRHMRLDMAAARRVEMKASAGPLDRRDQVLVLSMAEGNIRYRIETLVGDEPDPAAPPNTTQPPPAPEQRFHRQDAGGTSTWELHGQTLAFEAMPGAADRGVRVRFENRLSFKTGHRRARRFETTLIAGGRP